MALMFPAQSDATNAPRVRFKSQTWEMGKPTLANTKGAKLNDGADDIQLYLPGGFSEAYKANWQTEDLVTALTDVSDLRAWKASGWEALDNVFKGKSMTGISSAAKYGAGETSFPGKFLIFESTDAIVLNFNFEMVPRSSNEAAQISQICNTFKRKILPVFLGGLLQFPDVWTIQFLGIKGLGFPQTSTVYSGMALIGAVSNYNGGQSALTFNDGYPVSTTLQLTFQSIKQPYIDSGQ